MNYRKLTALYPLIGTFLIFMGIVKLHIYYAHFGLNIFDYLDFSEIITSFLDDINLFLLGTLLITLYSGAGSLLLLNSLKRTFSRVKQRTITISIVERYMAKPLKTKPVRVIFIVLSAVFVLLSWILFFRYLNIIWLFVFIMFFLQLILVFLEWVTGLNEDHVMTIALITVAFLFVWMNARLEITKIERYPGKATIITDSDTLITTDTRFMIGKTDKYLFVHEINGKNLVIPVLRLKQLSLE